jgi:bDLD-like protein/sulfatase-modifying factor enzyme 1
MTSKSNQQRDLLERIGADWRDLADYFELSNVDLARLEPGREFVGIVAWLKRRNRLSELPNGLNGIGRSDLVQTALELLQQPRESRELGTSKRRTSAAVRLEVITWSRLLGTRNKLADQLLHGLSPGSADETFKTLEVFLSSISTAGLSAETYNANDGSIEIVVGAEGFWLRIISTLIMEVTPNRSGALQWLIKETIADLRSSAGGYNVSKVWNYILGRYCDTNSEFHRPEFLSELMKIVIARTEAWVSVASKSEFLFTIINFLFEKLSKNTEAVKEITDYLRAYDQKIGNDESPIFLERLKQLIGIGSNICVHGFDDIPAFAPKLASINSHAYDFEAMVSPLTVLEISSLKGLLPQRVGDNAENPYVFKAVLDQGREVFNAFSGEVESIVSLANRYEPNASLEWDVPTVAEWRALADCVHQNYPWGNEPPSMKHANLDFGRNSRLRPVGSYPLGTSKFGTQDCIGNVHEIVRVSDRKEFPKDFRLAGGCYQTNVHVASRIIRRFRLKEPESRRNIGLRLIRYRPSDRARRFLQSQSVD